MFLFALALLGPSCARGPLQDTAYAGEGSYEGKPPMCFQSDTESRPSASSNYHLLAHFNNTCRYAVTCSVSNSINDKTLELNLPANLNRSLLIATNVPERSFDIDLECSWTP